MRVCEDAEARDQPWLKTKPELIAVLDRKSTARIDFREVYPFIQLKCFRSSNKNFTGKVGIAVELSNHDECSQEEQLLTTKVEATVRWPLLD
jgi:hypothetical protein